MEKHYVIIDTAMAAAVFGFYINCKVLAGMGSQQSALKIKDDYVGDLQKRFNCQNRIMCFLSR